MKGFLRSKLVLPLATAIMLASAIAIPLAGNIVHSHAAAPRLATSAHNMPMSTSANSINSPILFVHGIPGGNSQAIINCNSTSYWGDAKNFAKGARLLDGQQIAWASKLLVTVGYYTGDTCDVNLATSTGSNCKGYHDKNQGTNNESIRHLGCELAWYIYNNYTSKGQNVGVVSYSMGGLIIRWALSCSTDSPTKAAPCTSTLNKTPFPNAKLLVQEAVTFDTPHGGFPAPAILKNIFFPCSGNCVEFKEMTQGSVFLSDLNKYAQNPQGVQGTNWTLMGTWSGIACLALPPDSTIFMDGGTKILYVNPCYSHLQGERFDMSVTFDATVKYCISCPKSPPTWQDSQSAYPHSLLRTLYALSEFSIIDTRSVGGDIEGDFFYNPNDSGIFDVNPTTQPVFTVQSRVINFNPPLSMQQCTNSTGVDENTRPFHNVFRNANGSCTTFIVQGNGHQAGAGDLQSFEAVFFTHLTVAQAGNVTFHVFADDGWILSAGVDSQTLSHQPTYVSGSLVNAPQFGPFIGNFVVGAYNQPSSPTLNTTTVNFPAAGTFPIELDYTECCGGSLSLNFSSPSESYTS